MIHKETADSRQYLADNIQKSRKHVVNNNQWERGKSISTFYCPLYTNKKSLHTIYFILSTCKKEAGFTLIELLITMGIFILVIAAGSRIFTGLLTQFKQQSKIAETNIEGIVGLEILRRDIEHAGYGLPWNIPSGVTYSEASSSPASTYNDASNPPRATISGNGTGFNGSDYFVIKAINVATNDTSQKWTTLQALSPYVKTWTPSSENLAAGDSVIVLNPGATETNSRTLVVNGTTFSTTYNNVTSSPWPPPDVTEARIVYGIDDTTLRMPFNRADYFVRRFDGSGNNITPQRCAPNTGVLEKATVKQSDGGLTYLPLLDCVADMQVVYRRDTDNDGTIDNTTDDISALTAQQIRDQVIEIRVYIFAHEGQRDINYTQTPTTIYVGDPGIGGGRNFNIGTNLNYRWKLYTLVVRPNNLR